MPPSPVYSHVRFSDQVAFLLAVDFVMTDSLLFIRSFQHDTCTKNLLVLLMTSSVSNKAVLKLVVARQHSVGKSHM